MDTLGSMDLTQNSALNRRVKHVAVRHHFSRQVLLDEVTKIEYPPTEDMVLPKPLGCVKQDRLVSLMGLKRFSR